MIDTHCKDLDIYTKKTIRKSNMATQVLQVQRRSQHKILHILISMLNDICLLSKIVWGIDTNNVVKYFQSIYQKSSSFSQSPLSLILSREIERERGVQLESILLISALIIALKLNLDIKDNDSGEDSDWFGQNLGPETPPPQEEFSDNFNIFLKHISVVVIFKYDNI